VNLVLNELKEIQKRNSCVKILININKTKIILSIDTYMKRYIYVRDRKTQRQIQILTNNVRLLNHVEFSLSDRPPNLERTLFDTLPCVSM